MAQLSESRMNVAALKRVDPYVKDIVETAAHVALYTFNGDDNEWEKTEVEGALFVYSRTGEPFHNIIIMNRLNTNNFVEPVTQGLDLHIQDPFLLYRTARGSIFCIWFYDKEECSRIASALKKLVKETVQKGEKKNVKKQPMNVGNIPIIDPSTGLNLFSMLKKAQEDYDNTSSQKHENEENKDAKDMSNSTPRSVMEFFAKASSGTQFIKDGPKNNIQSNMLTGPRPLPPPGLTRIHQVPISLHQQNDVKIIQRLMSNPAHSVEHIEKQQRSLTPQSELAALMKSKAPNLVNAYKDNNKHSLQKNKVDLQGVEKSSTMQQNQVSSTSNMQSQIENGMGFLRINESTSPVQGTTVVHTQNFFNSNLGKSPILNDIPIEQRSLSAPHGSGLDATNSKPALMPPVMFTSSAVKEEPTPAVGISTNSNTLRLLSTNNHIMQPGICSKIQLEPLTKNQLLQAFNYLLKNDPDFIRMVHEAYVKSLSEMVS